MSDERAASFNRRLGRALATWREARGLPQEALAVQLSRDQSYISRIEAGERQASVVFLLDWAAALGIAFVDLAAELERMWSNSEENP
jgi:transcriptional regulator with XRE-family HTH domain